MNLSLATLSFVGLLASPAAASGTTGWTCSPADKAPALSGFSEDADLSGLARAGDYVLVVTDERTSVQLGRIDPADGSIRLQSALPLEPEKKKKDGGGELDLEGVCYSEEEKAFYVTGSHGVGKKKGDFQPLRYGVYRIPFDPAKGTLDAAGVTRSSLLPWLEESPDFRSSLRRPLQQNGFNIEGLATAGGRLYFGTRAPSADGHTFVIDVGAKELFADGGKGIAPAVHRIPLEADTGIRELAAVPGGLLLLSGNASAEPSKQFPVSASRRPDAGFALWHVALPAGTAPAAVKIGEVGAPGGKAEGLMVSATSPDRISLVVLHDGLPQGSPLSYTLTLPR